MEDDTLSAAMIVEGFVLRQHVGGGRVLYFRAGSDRLGRVIPEHVSLEEATRVESCEKARRLRRALEALDRRHTLKTGTRLDRWEIVGVGKIEAT